MRIEAKPYEYSLNLPAAALLIIDMQRDFLEPGGFGEMLGNDVAQLRRAIEPNRALLAAWRAVGGLVIHTREGHRPDLADLPTAKKSAAAAQPASATLGRWAASWCAAKLATTSFPNSIQRPESR